MTAATISDAWVQTASGRAYDLLAPTPEMVSAQDLAEQLAKTARYAGATPGVVYSVAQHSVLVGDALPPALRIWGYLHDAHEFALGDDVTPKLRALAVLLPGAREAVRELRARSDAAIHAAFGLTWPAPDEVAAAVHHADMRALATEKRDLLAPQPRAWMALPEPFPRMVKPWPWPKAADALLDRLRMSAPKVP